MTMLGQVARCAYGAKRAVDHGMFVLPAECGTSIGGSSGRMIDYEARAIAARVLDPVSERLGVPPMVLTVLGLTSGLAAAGFASRRLWLLALVLWLVSRIFDGLDGSSARTQLVVSDFGGYVDLMADMAVYVALPIGIAVGHDEPSTWVVVALLLGSFACNIVSVTHLATLLEKRGRGASATGERTSVTMPRGLVEGTETIVFLSLALAFPGSVGWILGAMAVSVAVGTLYRIRCARELLR